MAESYRVDVAAPVARTRRRRPWLRIFLVGLVLWIATVVITLLTATQAELFPVIEWSGLAVISAVGIAWLLVEWRRGRRGVLPARSWDVPIAQRQTAAGGPPPV